MQGYKSYIKSFTRVCLVLVVLSVMIMYVFYNFPSYVNAAYEVSQKITEAME